MAANRQDIPKPQPGKSSNPEPAPPLLPLLPPRPREIGGPPGPEPTRYGDWEVNGRCTDF